MTQITLKTYQIFNIIQLTGLKIYTNWRHLSLITAYYISHNLKAKMDMPVFNGTYSNTSEVADIKFLKDVEQFAREHRKITNGILCNWCKKPGAPTQPLQLCGGCHLVSYCNRDCQKSDRPWHKYFCKEFPIVNGKNALFTSGSIKEHIMALCQRAISLPLAEFNPVFLNKRVCHFCKEFSIDHLSDCLCSRVSYCNKTCNASDKFHKEQCIAYRELLLWSYPMALTFALESLPGHRLGRKHRALEKLTSLTIHIVTSSPLFNSEAWEEFMHQVPNLKQLNIVFIMQGKELKTQFNLNENLSLRRCEDCEIKNRIVNYSVHQMKYHMFFSSLEYTEPDVVVVYDCTYEMSANAENAFHSELSYRNMTYSRNTTVVLMDTTLEMVTQAAIAVNSARPVDQIVSPRLNKLLENLTDTTEFDFDADITNGKYYFTCLKRNKFI